MFSDQRESYNNNGSDPDVASEATTDTIESRGNGSAGSKYDVVTRSFIIVVCVALLATTHACG